MILDEILDLTAAVVFSFCTWYIRTGTYQIQYANMSSLRRIFSEPPARETPYVTYPISMKYQVDETSPLLIINTKKKFVSL